MAEPSALRNPFYSPQGGYGFVAGGTGALGGAAAGAALGSVVPGIGTAVGAIGGALIGALGGFGGGGPEAPSRMETARATAVANGLIPSGPGATIYYLALLDQGNQLALRIAAQAGLNVSKWLTTNRKKIDKFYATGEMPTTPEMMAVQSAQGGGGACQCDDRPLQLLAQLVAALQSQGAGPSVPVSSRRIYG